MIIYLFSRLRVFIQQRLNCFHLIIFVFKSLKDLINQLIILINKSVYMQDIVVKTIPHRHLCIGVADSVYV